MARMGVAQSILDTDGVIWLSWTQTMVHLELTFTLVGAEVWVGARGSDDRSTAPRSLGSAYPVERFTAFRNMLGAAIERNAEAVPDAALVEAKALYTGIFQGERRDLLRDLVRELTGAEELSLCLKLEDPLLKSIPWEALYRAEKPEGFLGVLAGIEVFRGVHSTEPPIAKDVRSKIRVLAIAPTSGSSALSTMEVALRSDPAITWMPPLIGPDARWGRVKDHLGTLAGAGGEGPHILHFVGHGKVDKSGKPCLRFADEEDSREPVWKKMERFAFELHPLFTGGLQLVYLEACEGAEPGSVASAAELLVDQGAEAVVAHLWSANSGAGRVAARQFYRMLTTSRDMVNVAACLRAARLELSDDEKGGEVHALSPVVYLRRSNPNLFCFSRPAASGAATASAGAPPPKAPAAPELPSAPGAPRPEPLDPALQKLEDGSFSLLLGDYIMPDARQRLRAALIDDLRWRPEDAQGMTLSSIAQRHALIHGGTNLREMFQRLFSLDDRQAIPELLNALAKRLRPGVHTSLLWLPLLEDALANQHPKAPIYVIHPPPLNNLGDAARVLTPRRDEKGDLVRDARGSVVWERPTPKDPDDPPLPSSPPLKEAYIVLRLYGGYTPEASPVLRFPLLTEDDYIEDLIELEDLSPPDWADALKAALNNAPVLFLGLSPVAARHRILLRKLFEQKASAGSVAVLGPIGGKTDRERETWKTEREIWMKKGGVLPSGQIGVLPRENLDRFLGIR